MIRLLTLEIDLWDLQLCRQSLFRHLLGLGIGITLELGLGLGLVVGIATVGIPLCTR